MKPFLTKAIDTLTFGTLRRRTPTLSNTSHDYNDSVSSASSTAAHHLALSRNVPCPNHTLPDRSSWCVYCSPSSFEDTDTSEDDLIFCKNNVYLKFPNRKPRSQNGSPNVNSGVAESSFTSSDRLLIPMNNVSADSSPTNQHQSAHASSWTGDDTGTIPIPGYFHLSTRGADFGQTLILNWTPNSSITTNSTLTQPSSLPQHDPYPFTPNPPPMMSSEATSNHFHINKPSVSSLSIDLSQMESIKIFYRDESTTIGELVICTRERRFKIFAFKHGGLNEVIKKFCQWKYFKHNHLPQAKQYTFIVFRPRLSLAQLHPEEGLVNGLLTENIWQQLKDPTGKILDRRLVLQTVFFRGLHPSLRSEVWPYLLGILEFTMTKAMSLEKRKKNVDIYQQINSKREQLQSQPESKITPLQLEQIRNDINRTDRLHPFYKGDDNANLNRLENILLNYLFVYRSDISYCQGMTDILSPLLFSLDNEVEAFFCFSVIIEKTAFFKPAKDRVSLRRQVNLLSGLVELLLPWFYEYLTETEDALTFVFAHRWLLVCLKREFKLEDTLTIWEACWTNYSTNFFIFFICIGILAMYGQQAIDQEMTLNELTVHFSSLSNSLPVDIVLSQARGYLYQFTQCSEVPCVLRSVMNDDFWDKSDSPRLVCGANCACNNNSIPYPSYIT